MTDAEKEIREALAAGPTPGEWFAVNDGTRGEPFMNVKAERISGRGPTHEVAICATGDSPQSMETANARYIAACHPAAIRELLAERDALAVENERLRDLLRIEQDLALRNDPFRCQQIECEWFGRRVRAGDCQCHHLQATEHRAKVCKALDAARGKE